MSIHGLSARMLAKKLDIDFKRIYQWVYDNEEPTEEEWLKFESISKTVIKTGVARPPKDYHLRVCKFLDKHDLKYAELGSLLSCMPSTIRGWATNEIKPQKKTWHRFIVLENLPVKEIQIKLESAYNPLLKEMLNSGLTKTEIGEIIGCSIDMVRYKLCGSCSMSKEESQRAKEWLKAPKFKGGNPKKDPHPELPSNYSKRIVEFRKRWGITQVHMAKLLKLNPDTFWRVENGERKLTEEYWNRFLAIEERGIAGVKPLPPNPGARIRKARKRAKISGPKLAKIAGWDTASVIYKAESGRPITPDTYHKIMEAINKAKK